MSLFLLVIAFLLGAVGLLIAGMGVRAFRTAGRILARRTRLVSQLDEGGVELAGRLTAPEPLLSLSEQRCVAVKTTIHGQSGDPKDEPTARGSKSLVMAAPGLLTDRSGTCRVDLEECELQGVSYRSELLPVETLAEVEWAMDLVPAQSTHVTIEETLILDGATVLLSGQARRDKADPTSYRDTQPEWVVYGAPEELLLVASEREWWLLTRTIAIPTFVTLIGAAMMGLSVGFLWVVASF